MFDFLKIVRTPKIATKVFNKALWRIPSHEKIIYLTFDDGPTPEVTNQVLELLKKYNAKATFFCIGKNILANKELFLQTITDGHTIGNHTQTHQNGWKTNNSNYFDEVAVCDDTIFSISGEKMTYFRPPYGKLKFSQYNQIAKSHKIVLWDVLSFDFDLAISKETVLQNVINHTRKGSIIVFHDSVKAKEKVLYALPLVLDYFSQKGYKFGKLC